MLLTMIPELLMEEFIVVEKYIIFSLDMKVYYITIFYLIIWIYPNLYFIVVICDKPIHLDNIKNGRIKDETVSLSYGSTLSVWCFEW